MTAVCADVAAPIEGAAYSACTSVVWTDASNLNTSIFSGLTMASGSLIAVAILTTWALAFVLRQSRKTVNL
jgi:hypothetical protein